jgi:RNA polymerase sigma-70 factor (family 1)
MGSRRNHSDLKDLTSEALLAMVKDDSMEAFEQLYFRYWKTLYAFAYNRLRSKEVAEEIVQEFLTNLWAGRHGFNLKTSFSSYIFVSVRNLVLNYIAKEMRRSAYSQFIKLFESDAENPTEQTVYIRDIQYNLQRELEFLPAKCRSVFEMSRHEHKTNKQIAKELGISEKTVESHLTKAIRRLRVSLNMLFFFF